jgi:hypothetical protein
VAKQLFSDQHERERFLFLEHEFCSSFFVNVKPMSNLIVQTPLEKLPRKIVRVGSSPTWREPQGRQGSKWQLVLEHGDESSNHFLGYLCIIFQRSNLTTQETLDQIVHWHGTVHFLSAWH